MTAPADKRALSAEERDDLRDWTTGTACPGLDVRGLARRLLDEYDALTAELARKDASLAKISAIRDNIIGTQRINWSAHVYPIVAALGEAGFEGAGYDKAREEACTLIDQLNAARAELAACRREREEVRAELADLKPEIDALRGVKAYKPTVREDALVAALAGVTTARDLRIAHTVAADALAAAQSAPSEREVCLGCGGDYDRCDCPAGSATTRAPQPAEATGAELPSGWRAQPSPRLDGETRWHHLSGAGGTGADVSAPGGEPTCRICKRAWNAEPGKIYCASHHGTCGMCSTPRATCKCLTESVMAAEPPSAPEPKRELVTHEEALRRVRGMVVSRAESDEPRLREYIAQQGELERCARELCRADRARRELLGQRYAGHKVSREAMLAAESASATACDRVAEMLPEECPGSGGSYGG